MKQEVKDDNVYIRHIADAIARIERYVGDIDDYEVFCSDEKTHDAVIRQLEIIGEASKRVSSDSRAKAVLIPWKDMSGMRDKLIHDYFGVDLFAVWKAAKEDVPVLKKEISGMLKTME